jgi:hypothetical protein
MYLDPQAICIRLAPYNNLTITLHPFFVTTIRTTRRFNLDRNCMFVSTPGWHVIMLTLIVLPVDLIYRMSTTQWHCPILGCTAIFDVGHALFRWDLQWHLGVVHKYPQDRVPVQCLCAGCRCLKQGPNGDKCPSHQPGHTWHGIDIVEHIWQDHLHFHDVCYKCGETGFKNTFSYNRHVQNCAGRTPSRCRVCLEEYPSKVALGGHMELGLCTGPPVNMY